MVCFWFLPGFLVIPWFALRCFQASASPISWWGFPGPHLWSPGGTRGSSFLLKKPIFAQFSAGRASGRGGLCTRSREGSGLGRGEGWRNAVCRDSLGTAIPAARECGCAVLEQVPVRPWLWLGATGSGRHLPTQGSGAVRLVWALSSVLAGQRFPLL